MPINNAINITIIITSSSKTRRKTFSPLQSSSSLPFQSKCQFPTVIFSHRFYRFCFASCCKNFKLLGRASEQSVDAVEKAHSQMPINALCKKLLLYATRWFAGNVAISGNHNNRATATLCANRSEEFSIIHSHFINEQEIYHHCKYFHN